MTISTGRHHPSFCPRHGILVSMIGQMDSIPPPPARRGASPEDIEAQLRSEQVRLVYQYLPVSQLVMVLNALVFAAVQSLVIDGSTVIGWFSAVCAVALVRIAGWVTFQRAGLQPAQVTRWRAMAIAGAGISGLVWGSAAFLLFPPMHDAHQVFVAFMLGGMVAGGMTTLAPVYPAFALFALLALVPAAARYSMQQDAVHYAMGWMVVVFLVAVLVIARRSRQGISDLLRLRFENAALVGELLVARDQLKRARNPADPGTPER